MPAPARPLARRPLPRRVDPADPRAAILRWRTRKASTHFSAQALAAVKLVPALLHACFPRGNLKVDAPGIFRFTRVPAARVAREVGIPPPTSLPRSRPLLSAVLAAPEASSAVLVLVTNGALNAGERARLEVRLAAIAPILEPKCRGLRFEVVEQLDPHSALGISILLQGILLAGRPLPGLWRNAAPTPESLKVLGDAAVASASPFVAASTVWVAASRTCAAQLAAQLLSERVPARALADSDVLWAFTAARAHAQGRLCAEALAIAGSKSGRVFATKFLQGGDAQEAADLLGVALPQVEARDASGMEEVLQLSSKLARESLRALEALPRSARAPFRTVIRRELLASGAFRALLPALAKTIEESGLLLGGSIVDRRVRKIREVRDKAGARLGRGATTHQARIRALGLIAAAVHRSPLPPTSGRAWSRVASRLCEPTEKRTLLVVTYADRTVPTKGPAVKVARAVGVLLRPGRRPTSYRVKGMNVSRAVLREALAGTVIEPLAATPEDEPAANKMMQLAQTVASRRNATGDFAVQSGDEVLSAHDGKVRVLSADRFFSRPRATELVREGARALRAGPKSRFGPVTVDCEVSLENDTHAWLLYSSAEGHAFREHVAVIDLEEHIKDGTLLLRRTGALLNVLTPENVFRALRRTGAGPRPTTVVEVGGSLPHGLWARINEERFGRRQPLGWNAAAQVTLSAWPLGHRGRLSVTNVELDGVSAQSTAMASLYARAVAMRRLWANIDRMIEP